MIDLFTSALSDCQNAFSILCEGFNSIEEVTLSIVRELKSSFCKTDTPEIHDPPPLICLIFGKSVSWQERPVIKISASLLIYSLRACSHEPGTVNYPEIMIAPGQALPRVHMMICCPGQRCPGTTVAHKGQCNKKWFAGNKKDRMQTKKIGCKQNRSDTNKKDNANKKDRMQTKRIGCKQKTKTCHDASSNLDQLPPSLATSYKLQIMILKSWWTWLMGLIGLVYTKYSQPRICSCPFDIIPFSFQFADPFTCILSFLFASWQVLVFCLHSDLCCLHPIFFVCSKPFFIALTLVGHRTGQVHFHLITANWSQFL